MGTQLLRPDGFSWPHYQGVMNVHAGPADTRAYQHDQSQRQATSFYALFVAGRVTGLLFNAGCDPSLYSLFYISLAFDLRLHRFVFSYQ